VPGRPAASLTVSRTRVSWPSIAALTAWTACAAACGAGPGPKAAATIPGLRHPREQWACTPRRGPVTRTRSLVLPASKASISRGRVYPAEAALSRLARRPGPGLTIARGIVEIHSGTIGVGRRPGKDCAFTCGMRRRPPEISQGLRYNYRVNWSPPGGRAPPVDGTAAGVYHTPVCLSPDHRLADPAWSSSRIRHASVRVGDGVEEVRCESKSRSACLSARVGDHARIRLSESASVPGRRWPGWRRRTAASSMPAGREMI